MLIRGVQRHPGDTKCLTKIFGGTKIRKLGEAEFTFLFHRKMSELNRLNNQIDVMFMFNRTNKNL